MLQANFVGHLERLVARRRENIEPERRRVVAQVCTGVLQCILDEMATRPDRERSELLTDLKLALTAYLAVALSPQQR